MAFGSKKKKAEFKFPLGSLVKDKITGFEGVIVCRTQWLHNCNAYGVKPVKLRDDKPMDNQYFDEPQMELVKQEVIKPKQKTGGPARPIPQTNR